MYGKARKTKTQMLADIAADHPGAIITHAQKDPSKRNTIKYGIRDGDFIDQYLRYQDTDIIRWVHDGSIVLNTGGWRTVTTKARYNEHLDGIQVYQTRGIWYLSAAGKRVEFYDGMVINPDGTVIDTGSVESDRVKDYTKRINKFCKLVTEDNLPVPENGDCWICMMFEKDGNKSDVDHLESHMDEGYVHGSLLANAMRAAGFRDEQIGFHYQMKYADAFKRALRRFLKARFQIGS
jgi:hypothetical protein